MRVQSTCSKITASTSRNDVIIGVVSMMFWGSSLQCFRVHINAVLQILLNFLLLLLSLLLLLLLYIHSYFLFVFFW